jgi:hypothetical protein
MLSFTATLINFASNMKQEQRDLAEAAFASSITPSNVVDRVKKTHANRRKRPSWNIRSCQSAGLTRDPTAVIETHVPENRGACAEVHNFMPEISVVVMHHLQPEWNLRSRHMITAGN